MVEYVIVVVFGILVLTTGPGADVIEEVMQALETSYDGYSYAVSLSDYPDLDDKDLLYNLLVDQGVPKDIAKRLADDPVALFEDMKGFVEGARGKLGPPPELGDFDADLLPTDPGEILDFL